MEVPRNESVGVDWVKCIPSVVWVAADESEVVLPRGFSGGLVAEEFSNVQIARVPTSLILFTHLPRGSQAVEKVVVGPVGGPKEARNKTKNTTKTAFSAPELGAEESAEEFFNTLVLSKRLSEWGKSA